MASRQGETISAGPGASTPRRLTTFERLRGVFGGDDPEGTLRERDIREMEQGTPPSRPSRPPDFEGGGKGLGESLNKFGSSVKDNPETSLMFAGLIDDLFKRGQQGQLAATDAATAGFAGKGSSALKAFQQGVGGFDPVGTTGQAFALSRLREERDKLAKIRENQFGASSKRDSLTSEMLEERLRELKAKRIG